MTVLDEYVYLGYENKVEITLYSNGVAIPFVTNGVTELRLYIYGLVASSSEGYITFDDSGNVTLDMGGFPIKAGEYIPKLVAYSATSPDGEVLLSKYTDTMLRLTFV